jgi:hypothetical protein
MNTEHKEQCEQWWNLLLQNKNDLRYLISQYHPFYKNQCQAEINSDVKRFILESTEKSPCTIFNQAVVTNNHQIILNVLNDTWLGIPTQLEGSSILGYMVLCQLLDDSKVFEDDIPCGV